MGTPGLGTVLQAWMRDHAGDDARIQAATAHELERLLGVEIDAMPVDLGAFIHHAGRRLDKLGGAAGELVTLLAPDRQRPGASLVEALAEILFVPRRERTEYVTHRLTSPPWDIRRLLIEYAVWSQRVDEAATGLTRGFCAERCDRPPIGCCSILGYDLGLVPKTMLVAQELEARRGGWVAPAREDKCKFHGPRGCCLRRFKSPACTGMLCEPLRRDLEDRFPRGPLDDFLRPLALYRNHVIDRERIFDLMREVVAAAARLAALEPEIG